MPRVPGISKVDGSAADDDARTAKEDRGEAPGGFGSSPGDSGGSQTKRAAAAATPNYVDRSQQLQEIENRNGLESLILFECGRR